MLGLASVPSTAELLPLYCSWTATASLVVAGNGVKAGQRPCASAAAAIPCDHSAMALG
jgi:hypothetical protein